MFTTYLLLCTMPLCLEQRDEKFETCLEPHSAQRSQHKRPNRRTMYTEVSVKRRSLMKSRMMIEMLSWLVKTRAPKVQKSWRLAPNEFGNIVARHTDSIALSETEIGTRETKAITGATLSRHVTDHLPRCQALCISHSHYPATILVADRLWDKGTRQNDTVRTILVVLCRRFCC